MPTQPVDRLPAIVLDTNVVLDWLVFHNPEGLAIGSAVEHGRLQWLTTDAMRDELAHVLGRRTLFTWAPDEGRIWETWARLSTHVAPPAATPYPRLRCTDPDDQKFLDLALAHARWLLSRDRAVLKLARRAAPLGLEVSTPTSWLKKREP